MCRRLSSHLCYDIFWEAGCDMTGVEEEEMEATTKGGGRVDVEGEGGEVLRGQR